MVNLELKERRGSEGLFRKARMVVRRMNLKPCGNGDQRTNEDPDFEVVGSRTEES
jgi:hypothetical protein